MRTCPAHLVIFAAFALLGCDNKPKMDAQSASDRTVPMAPPAEAQASGANEDRMAASTMGRLMSSPAAPPMNQFVRSADLRFRCRSVVQSTAAIEDIVAENGGFVALDALRSSVDSWRKRAYGRDSLLEIDEVEVENTLQLRVPNDRLDTVLARIAPLIQFLDARTVRAEDVRQELRRAEREHHRLVAAGKRLQDLSQDKPGKVRDLADVDEQALQREDRADASLERADGLKEQVALSTVQIALYQHPETRLDTLSRPFEEIWREPFWRRAARSVGEGWEGFQDLVLWLASHWFLFAILGAIAYFVRWRRIRSRKAKVSDSD